MILGNLLQMVPEPARSVDGLLIFGSPHLFPQHIESDYQQIIATTVPFKLEAFFQLDFVRKSIKPSDLEAKVSVMIAGVVQLSRY